MPWASLPVSTFAQTSIVTHHNHVQRTGANLAETVLTTTNVNVSEFGKLFERAVDDEIYAQPLYVAGVNIPGIGVKNVVYVATNNDSVYAFDADYPAASAPRWRVNYTDPSAGIVPVSRTDVGQAVELTWTSRATSGSPERRRSICHLKRCTSSRGRKRTARSCSAFTPSIFVTATIDPAAPV